MICCFWNMSRRRKCCGWIKVIELFVQGIFDSGWKTVHILMFSTQEVDSATGNMKRWAGLGLGKCAVKTADKSTLSGQDGQLGENGTWWWCWLGKGNLLSYLCQDISTVFLLWNFCVYHILINSFLVRNREKKNLLFSWLFFYLRIRWSNSASTSKKTKML